MFSKDLENKKTISTLAFSFTKKYNYGIQKINPWPAFLQTRLRWPQTWRPHTSITFLLRISRRYPPLNQSVDLVIDTFHF